jgi:hypothetical protein
MKDCAGGHHPDDEPVTWRQFDREMAHRAEIQRVKEDALQKALDVRAAQMLTSHRILIAVVSIIAIGVQLLVYFRR